MTGRQVGEQQPDVEPSSGAARWWMGPAVLLITSFFLFVVLETGFRLAGTLEADVDPAAIWASYDEELGYVNRPGWGSHNAHGFHDDPVEEPKRRFRLLMLGDSVIYYGDDPADTLPGRIESRLAAQGSAVEVVNAGVRGYTNFQQTRWLERFGLALDPDAIGLVFVLNDLHHFLHRFAVRDGQIIGTNYVFADEAVETVANPVYQLLRKSVFLVWLRRQLGVFDDLIEVYTGQGFTFDHRPDFAPAWQEEPWQDVERQLAATRQLSRERGIPFFLVVVPFAEQLRPEILERAPDYVRSPQRRLAEIAARLEIPILDLFELLDAELDLEEDQVHLTKRGKERSAESITRFLLGRGLVPAAGDSDRIDR